jgi:hypothetical protein
MRQPARVEAIGFRFGAMRADMGFEPARIGAMRAQTKRATGRRHRALMAAGGLAYRAILALMAGKNGCQRLDRVGQG